WVLLILTFALGVGAAMNAPAWQATAPELVSRAELSAAVGLTGIGLNLARAVGPALGGAVIAMAGPAGGVFVEGGWVFWVDWGLFYLRREAENMPGFPPPVLSRRPRWVCFSPFSTR